MHEIETTDKDCEENYCCLSWGVNCTCPSCAANITTCNTVRTEVESPAEGTVLNEEEKSSSYSSIESIFRNFIFEDFQKLTIFFLFIRLSIEGFDCFDRAKCLVRTCICFLVELEEGAVPQMDQVDEEDDD